MLWKQNNWNAQNYSCPKVIRSTRIWVIAYVTHTQRLKCFYPTCVTDLSVACLLCHRSNLKWNDFQFENSCPFCRRKVPKFNCARLLGAMTSSQIDDLHIHVSDSHFNNGSYQWLCRWRIHAIRFMLKKMSTCIIIHFCPSYVGL